MHILQKKIILASKSPRRSQLLREAGFNFEIRTQDTPEDYPETLSVDEVAPFLAEKKAEACRHFLTDEDSVILAADSVVILENEIYQKPENFADGVRILRALSGQTHRVITGVCLLSKQHKKIFSGRTEVTIAPLSEEEIHFYLEQYRPYDKAGAYAVQEWIGLCKITRMEGTYANVMGLPVDLVYQELAKF